ncbi:NAD(P)-binding protein [Sarocladium strictum]
MSQKTALVTGCRQGSIGDCIARELHRRGFRVYATARTQSSLEHYEGTGINPLMLDVSDSRSIKELCTSLAEELTGLDILINNAGVGMCSMLLDIDLAMARSVVDVNIFGLLELTQGLISLLRETSGTIVNIGSVMGRLPFWGGCIYGMSKAALEQLSRHMRTELALFGIRVIHINGGGVQTDFFQHTTGGSLPAKSPYYRARDTIGPWVSGERLRSLQRMSPQKFAKAVVTNALRSNPASVQWIGYGAWAAWLFSSLLWYNATDILLRILGSPKLSFRSSQVSCSD